MDKNALQAGMTTVDARNRGHLIISPFLIIFIASILYYGPVIILQLYGYNLFASYAKGIKLHDPLLSHGVVVLVLFFLALVAAGTKFRPVFKLEAIRSDSLFWLVFWIYACMAGLSLLVLASKLELLSIVHDLFFEPVQFAVKISMVGVTLSSGGLLKFYLGIHFLPVLWYLWATNYECKKWFVAWKIFLVASFALIFFIFFLMTRRELILYLVLILLLGFGGRVKKTYIFALLSLVAAVFVYLISMRLGDVSFGPERYFTSEEFYPYQLSLLLIDEWLRQPYIKNLLQITPAVFLTNMPTVISPSIMSEYFNHNGPGPTMGLPYAIVAFGILYPCMYVAGNFFFLNQIRALIAKVPENARLIPLYAILLLKLFLLVRNGELFNHFLDSVMFVTLYLPFIFVVPRGQRGSA